jgi:hypothetical protein
MQRIRYTEEFKAEAIKQITERGHGVYQCNFVKDSRYLIDSIQFAKHMKR